MIDKIEAFKKLAEPFPEHQVSWMVKTGGKTTDGKVWARVLAYIDARDCQDRLDAIIGPDNWSVSYTFPGPKHILAHLTIFGITKTDGAEETEVESFKGGLSSAFKRVCSVWTIGRYLYGLGDNFAQIVEKGTKGAIYSSINLEKDRSKPRNMINFYWIPPKLPDWALPQPEMIVGPNGPIPKIDSKAPNSQMVGRSTPNSAHHTYDGPVSWEMGEFYKS